MRVNRYTILFVIGLVLTLGLSAVMANGVDKKTKRPKNAGILSVKTNDKSYPIKVDGQFIGNSGVATGAEFYLAPGYHTIEVTAPDGTVWEKDILIRRGEKECICLRITPKPPVDCKVDGTCPELPRCPYRFNIDGPRTFTKGQTITFTAVNSGTQSLPSKYNWKITPKPVEVEGLGTESIRIDTSLTGDETINLELDFNDESIWKYDNGCKEDYSATPIEKPRREPCDEFLFAVPDDYKNRLDNCVIRNLGNPNAKALVIIHPGTDRTGTKRYTYEKLYRLTLEFLINKRKLDRSQFDIVRGSPRQSASIAIWINYPGDDPPPIN